jgi:hypothetical protein
MRGSLLIRPLNFILLWFLLRQRTCSHLFPSIRFLHFILCDIKPTKQDKQCLLATVTNCYSDYFLRRSIVIDTYHHSAFTYKFSVFRYLPLFNEEPFVYFSQSPCYFNRILCKKIKKNEFRVLESFEMCVQPCIVVHRNYLRRNLLPFPLE